jgi:hypothetical protein
MQPIDPAQLDAQDPLKWTRDEFEIPLQSHSGGDGTHDPPAPPRLNTLNSLPV